MKESKNYYVRIVKRTYDSGEHKYIVQVKGKDWGKDALWLDSANTPQPTLEKAEEKAQEFIEWDNVRSQTVKNEEIVG